MAGSGMSGHERLTVRCLGSLELSVGGARVQLRGARLRTVFAVLALASGRAVHFDRLVTAVWAEQPPTDPRASLHNLVNRLRATVGAEALVATAAGYRLLVEPEDVDAVWFDRLIDAAAADADRERDLLDQALVLWRGTPFADVGSSWLEQYQTPRLTERYLQAVERRADLAIADGDSAGQLARLVELAAQHPVRESLWERLLRSQEQCGRTAEALERYEMLRARLVETLGVDPGERLQVLHLRLLARTEAPRVLPHRPVPRQLPADVEALVGRAGALRQLDRRSGVAVITGMAGVGKTALAVHWAHRVVDRFPDGQLYANLRGFDPAASPDPPADILRSFLVALGLPAEQVPADADARAAMYRSLLANRQVLVVLDNAHDTDQVRPLLPGASGCLTVVTSRDHLLGVIAGGARPVVLEPLTPTDAVAMLSARIGVERLAAEPHAAAELAELCGGLPLAVSIVAARAAVHPGFTVDDLAAELRTARQRLDALSGTDPATDVRAVFSWSYDVVGGTAAQLFRALGLFPGAELSAAAAASLIGAPERDVRGHLAELHRAHLIFEPRPGRYGLHDLLRAYAAELVNAEDPAPRRREMIGRVVDHYLHTAHNAALRLYPHRDPLPLPDRDPLTCVVEFAGHDGASAWFESERSNLIGICELAHRAGLDPQVARLVPALSSFFGRRSDWRTWIGLLYLALEASERSADLTGQEFAHRFLASAHIRQRDLNLARTHLDHCFAMHRRIEDKVALGRAHRVMGLLLDAEDRPEAALDHALIALELFEAAGVETGYAETHNTVGFYYVKLGRLQEALEHCHQALPRLRAVGHRGGEADTLDSLGHIHRALGQFDQARENFVLSLDLYRSLGDRYYQAVAHREIGDLDATADRSAEARRHWTAALAILEDLHHPDADQLRSKLGARSGAQSAGR